ncbi:proline utilization trans-activator [Microdochium nivale]|nr:proline utilization trans-activator [Microdochium nivale]
MNSPAEGRGRRQSSSTTTPGTLGSISVCDDARKRSHGLASGEDAGKSPNNDSTANRRKSRKVSRACDHCKQRKARCSGTLPCTKCIAKGIACIYDTRYSRGRPPTPQPASAEHRPDFTVGPGMATVFAAAPSRTRNAASVHPESMGPASRASPELGMTEIGGQVFDPTSGMTFLHRAWRRLANPSHTGAPLSTPTARTTATTTTEGLVEQQHVRHAGHQPPRRLSEEDLYCLTLPPHHEVVRSMALYFDVCMATYRVLHRPSVEDWVRSIELNINQGQPAWKDIGRPKAAIIFICLAVAMAHDDKPDPSGLLESGAVSLAAESDRMFDVCTQLLEPETDLPSLHSAQARILQTLYLLTKSRMNKAWYTFGHALQIISALGLHRKTTRQLHKGPSQPDYLQGQLRMRTFWTAYILDKYLGVIFGRPRHYHDEDIDQEFPDRLEDEDITPQGPLHAAGGDHDGCHTDALIFHAKIAQIIGQISREVYTIRPISEADRIGAAHRLSKQLDDWKASLPAYLVSVRPSMLVPSFRRQSIVLKLAYCHAIMHANRMFLLSTLRQDSRAQIDECLGAARSVFEVVDGLAHDGAMFHAFWWTQYVTFCALVVCYVWDMQLKRRGTVLDGSAQVVHSKLIDLARRCQFHMATATAQNSPSRRYAVILEEFCSEVMGSKTAEGMFSVREPNQPQATSSNGVQGRVVMDPALYTASEVPLAGGELRFSLLDEWNTTDWLELDSSAFGPYMNIDSSWIPNLDLSGSALQATQHGILDF